ncbi:MAG: hypothetical protein WD063_16965 [Pirellulales bacterium]
MTLIDEFRRDPERVFDRLVDGELGLLERGELLAALDDEPGAWRCCALAFLEAQSWRWQLSRMATEPILAQLSKNGPNGPARRGAFLGGALAIAASLAVAFVLGTRFPTTHSDIPLATNEQSAPKGPQAHTVARPDSLPTPVDLAVEQVEQDDPAGATGDTPWQTLTLTPVGGTGSGEPIQLRVVESDDAGQLFAERSSLSSQLTGRLEQEGWEVNRRRRLLPIDLSDGRQVVVPIEEVDLHRPQVVQF